MQGFFGSWVDSTANINCLRRGSKIFQVTQTPPVISLLSCLQRQNHLIYLLQPVSKCLWKPTALCYRPSTSLTEDTAWQVTGWDSFSSPHIYTTLGQNAVTKCQPSIHQHWQWHKPCIHSPTLVASYSLLFKHSVPVPLKMGMYT